MIETRVRARKTIVTVAAAPLNHQLFYGRGLKRKHNITSKEYRQVFQSSDWSAIRPSCKMKELLLALIRQLGFCFFFLKKKGEEKHKFNKKKKTSCTASQNHLTT
jgi:hypothetical protein